MIKERQVHSTEEALKLALENYMAAFGQALEAYGIELQQQQIEADRLAREALAQPAVTESHKRKPLTDEFLRKLHHIDQFGLFCDYDDFEQISRAIEAAHGIKE